MSRNSFHPSYPSEIPSGVSYAIITGSSRDDGYGGQSKCVDYTGYTDRKEWEARIVELMEGPYSRDFKALEVKAATIGVTINVEVK
jgi:hypothetical protein